VPEVQSTINHQQTNKPSKPSNKQTMYYLFLSLSLVSSLGLWGQHIYVRSYAAETEGGWIVTPEGETLYELPAQWRVVGEEAAMAPVEEWPLLLWKRGYNQQPNAYALLHQDARWEELPQWKWATVLGHQLVSVTLEGNQGMLWHKDGRVVSREFNMVGKYNEASLAIAGNGTHQGLIDTLGQWCLSPSYRSMVSLGKDHYMVEDTLRHSYLLHLKSRTEKPLQWDTLADLTANQWRIRISRSFSEDGYILLNGEGNQLLIMDTTGQLRGQNLALEDRGNQDFSEGLMIVGAASGGGRKLGIVSNEGQWIKRPQFDYLLDYQDGRALAHDTLSDLFGYLNRDGIWAIEPRYCEATSFRYGLAIVNDPVASEGCQGIIRQRGAMLHRPAELTHNTFVRNYLLIDTNENVVWQDSCREVWLPLPGVVGCNYNESTLVPAYRLEWLATGAYWLSPGFVFTRWAQLGEVASEEVVRLNLGARRWQLFHQQIYPLPEDFAERLPTLRALEDLNLDYHEVAGEWEAILAKKGLRKLALRNCKLTLLPKAIKALKQLEELDISENNLTELPRKLFRMKHLRVLNITDNPLPPAIIPRLRKALPDTKIVYK
jgi:hypothetical protein